MTLTRSTPRTTSAPVARVRRLVRTVGTYTGTRSALGSYTGTPSAVGSYTGTQARAFGHYVSSQR